MMKRVMVRIFSSDNVAESTGLSDDDKHVSVGVEYSVYVTLTRGSAIEIETKW